MTIFKNKNTRITVSFKNNNQLALFEVVKEQYNKKELEHAEIIFQIKGKEYKKALSNF